MPLSSEMRRLQRQWQAGTGWPKRLHWVEIVGIRGWNRQRFDLRFPIMAVVGENGAGKSTLLQAAATIYQAEPDSPRLKKYRFASDFFPETPWDEIRNAEIKGEIKEGTNLQTVAIRKPTGRWRGYQERPHRHVVYIDLSRIQPVPARVGYTRLAKASLSEASSEAFEDKALARFSAIMGRKYDEVKMAITDADPNREVPVVSHRGAPYSGFHSGAGEITMAELLQAPIPAGALVLIDEVETSLHPRVQRQLIRDLAALARARGLQVILTTHSPFVLEELPLDARAYILQPSGGGREIVYGVSPEFAMTKMDEFPHPECDLYVEDPRAETMLTEILAAHRPELIRRTRTIPFGAASVGRSLGEMRDSGRFPDPVCVFLDGDQGSARGCLALPGGDPPEQVVFDALKEKNWAGLASRTGRDFADVADACDQAMALSDHHDWVRAAASTLVLGGDILWQAMCAEWANACLSKDEAAVIWQPIEDAIGHDPVPVRAEPESDAPATQPTGPQTPAPTPSEASPPTDLRQLSLQSPDDAPAEAS
ncbi:MAG TPA: AAA family ATPase [Solirubrobacterales bacterium]|nr:AAA family ATPase [Solirubrobacterales bacterium]